MAKSQASSEEDSRDKHPTDAIRALIRISVIVFEQHGLVSHLLLKAEDSSVKSPAKLIEIN